MDCVSPCPTGSIDNWRVVTRSNAYSVEAQLGWDELLKDPDSYFYVCGLKSMEEGVVLALRDVAREAGLSWEEIGAALKRDGRLHLETY